MGLADLGYANQQQGRAVPRPIPCDIVRERRRRKEADLETKAKDAVWKRDEHKSRASGVPVFRAHTDPRKRGEVAHLVSRSRDPKDLWQLSRLILLTAEEHRLSDPRTANASGKALLEIVPFGRQRSLNGNRVLTFIRCDVNGRELWRRSS